MYVFKKRKHAFLIHKKTSSPHIVFQDYRLKSNILQHIE